MSSEVFDMYEPIVQRTSVTAAELIRQAVMDGRLAPGQRLKETDLATQLGISRTPIREALRLLESEGLLISSPHRGATVKSYAPEELSDLYQMRALLEGFAAHRAAEHVTEKNLRLLQESCDRFTELRKQEDIAALVQENLVFHRIILKTAANSWLEEFVARVMNVPLVYKSYYWFSPELRLISEHCHRRLTQALVLRDGERAEMIMKQHILEASDFLIERFNLNGVEVVEGVADAVGDERSS